MTNPTYQGDSKAVHVLGDGFSVTPVEPVTTDPVYKGVAPSIVSKSGAPDGLNIDTLVGPVETEPVYRGRSPAIHVFGEEGSTPAGAPFLYIARNVQLAGSYRAVVISVGGGTLTTEATLEHARSDWSDQHASDNPATVAVVDLIYDTVPSFDPYEVVIEFDISNLFPSSIPLAPGTGALDLRTALALGSQTVAGNTIAGYDLTHLASAFITGDTNEVLETLYAGGFDSHTLSPGADETHVSVRASRSAGVVNVSAAGESKNATGLALSAQALVSSLVIRSTFINQFGSVSPHVFEQTLSGVTISADARTFDFTSVSNAHVVSWLWDFGDGSTSTEENPTHTYVDAGPYTVTLTVTFADGSTRSTTEFVYEASYPLPPEASPGNEPAVGQITFRRQIGDPTTTLDAHICTLESGAMALEWHTHGALGLWGGELVPWCGKSEAYIAANGTSLQDLALAWSHFGQTFEVRGGRPWSDLIARLHEARAVVVGGDYGSMPAPYKCSSYTGNHAIIMLPYFSGSDILIGDPICYNFKWVPESAVRTYAEAEGVAIYGATSPQAVYFGVTQPWA